MRFYINSLKRVVNLSDELIKECSKYEEVTENIFIIPIIAKYPKYDKKNVSDEELSLYCDEILLAELELFKDIPDIINCIEKNNTKLKREECVEIKI